MAHKLTIPGSVGWQIANAHIRRELQKLMPVIVKGEELRQKFLKGFVGDAQTGKPPYLGATVNTRLQSITPTAAAEYLKQQPEHQRPLNERRVEAFVKEMLAGNWMATHQGIAFDEQGHLIDGQHRLHAVVRANVTVRMQVSYDVPAASFAKIDAGAVRTNADLYVISGGTGHPTLIMASARAMIIGLVGTGGRDPLQRERILRVAMRHRDMLSDLAARIGHKQPFGAAPVIAAFAKSMLVRGAKTQTSELVDYVVAGLWKSPNDPFKKLADRIYRQGRGQGTRLERSHLYALTVSAIRAALENRELGHIGPTTLDFMAPKGALD